MLSEREDRAIKMFCSANSDGMLLAFGLISEEGFYKVSIKGRTVIPFWSNREELERIQLVIPDMAKYEIIDLDVIFLVSIQFQEIDSQGNFVGINWGPEPNEWWARPVTEVEDAIRTELRWPK